MARPREDGLKYFPLDVNFFSSRKIKILKSRFGADGITVFIYILCEIYRGKGYFVEKDDDLCYIIADDLSMSIEKIEQILKFLLERSLLVEIKVDKSRKLFKSDTIITARSIQEQYQESTRGLKRSIEIQKELWLLEEENTASHVKFAHVDVSPRKTGVNLGKTGVNLGKTGQMKLNEKKGNKTKENETKENEKFKEPFFKNEVINSLFLEFLEIRETEHKIKNTEHAITMLLNKIKELPDELKIKTIEESIMCHWKGLFPDRFLKKESKQENGNGFLEMLKETPKKEEKVNEFDDFF